MDYEFSPQKFNRKDLNMSVDFNMLAANKNYMRLTTTSANRRYQNSSKW